MLKNSWRSSLRILKANLFNPDKGYYKSLVNVCQDCISYPSSPVHKGEKGSNENQSIKVRK